MTNKVVGGKVFSMSATVLQMIRDPQAAALLLEPKRQATGLGKILEIPRQKVNYHLHQLERADLVEQLEIRKKGSVQKRLVRATATQYLISPEALGQLGASTSTRCDKFSIAYLVAAASPVSESAP